MSIMLIIKRIFSLVQVNNVLYLNGIFKSNTMLKIKGMQIYSNMHVNNMDIT